MSAVAERAPEQVLTERMRAYRRQGAELAALILKFAPERIAEMTIGDFLLQIPYMTAKLAGGWLARAGINPWRPGSSLSVRERYLLVGQLLAFAKDAA